MSKSKINFSKNRILPNLVKDKVCSFEIEKILGSGYFATTYLVKNGDIFQALKVNDFLHNSVVSETNYMQIINHPYIIRAQEIFTGQDCNNNSFSYLMEYCPKNFGQLIESRSYTLDQIFKYFYQLLCCNHFLFLNGFCHNDINKRNIAIDENDNIKLLDLGIMSENISKEHDLDSIKYIFEILTESESKKLNANNPYLKDYKNKKLLRSFLKIFHSATYAYEIMRHEIFDPYRKPELENLSTNQSPFLIGYDFERIEFEDNYSTINKYFEKSMDWFYINCGRISIKLIFLYSELYTRILNTDIGLQIKDIDIYARYLACFYYNLKIIPIIREKVKSRFIYSIMKELQFIIGENRALKSCKSLEDIVKVFEIIKNNLSETSIYENDKVTPNYYYIDDLDASLKLNCEKFLKLYYYVS